jgi:phage repressor protein C with HTH and peptisase S24 domain
MFKQKANTACNNILFTYANMLPMTARRREIHPTAERLLEAAKILRGAKGPSDVARLLDVSAQKVTNWMSRGVSADGLLAAERLIGCRAVWLQTGEGEMVDTSAKHVSAEVEGGISVLNAPVIADSQAKSPATIDATKLTSPQRLKAALQSTVTAETLASVTGVGIEVAAQWLGGVGPALNLAQAAAVQNTYGVNSVWLIKGKGDAGVAVRYADEYRPIPITNWKPIPVLGMAQLGDNGYWSELEYPVGHGDGYVDFPSRDPDAYALRCVGDSMRPRIRDGEFVIVEPNHEVEPGDDVLVKSTDGRVMVKTFLYSRAGRIHLISINEAHPPVAFPKDEIDKMHYVVAYTRASMWRPI